MSRTDKDRPYWVRSVDPTENRSAYHYHTQFGKEVYRTYRVYDEKGEPVWEEREYTRYVPNPAWYDSPHYTVGAKSEQKSVWIPRTIPVKETRLMPKYERVLIGHYATYCSFPSADKAQYKRGRWGDTLLQGETNVFATCDYYLNEYQRYNRPEAWGKQNYNSTQRAKRQQALHRAVKYYNSDYEDEYYDDDELLGRERRHYGWWD